MGSSSGASRRAARQQMASAQSAILEQAKAREEMLKLIGPYSDFGKSFLPGLGEIARRPIDYGGLPIPRLLEFGGGYSPVTPENYTPAGPPQLPATGKTAPLPQLTGQAAANRFKDFVESGQIQTGQIAPAERAMMDQGILHLLTTGQMPGPEVFTPPPAPAPEVPGPSGPGDSTGPVNTPFPDMERFFAEQQAQTAKPPQLTGLAALSQMAAERGGGFRGGVINAAPAPAQTAQQQGIQPLQGGGMLAGLVNQQIASGALTPANLEQVQVPQGIQPTGRGGFIGGLINQIAAANPAPAPTTQQAARPAVMPDMQGRPVPPQAPTDFLGGFRALNPPGGLRFDAQGNEIPQAPVTMIGNTPVSAEDMARLRETRDYLGSWREINAGRTPTGDQMLQGPGFGMTPAPQAEPLLPALPSVTPQSVGPLPTLRPRVTGLPELAPIAGRTPRLAPVQTALPELAPIQGALPGVSMTSPAGLPALAPTPTTGLPGLNIVGPEQLPGLPAPVQPELPRISPIAQVGPALGPTAQMAGALAPTAQMGPALGPTTQVTQALAPTAQMGPALGPVLPTDLPTIGANIQQDSLFQALKREAIGGIEASAAARGKLFSGTTPQAIAERVQNLALARAGDIQAQNIAARQQLMGEAQQQFGQQLAGRQLGGAEAERLFAQQAAAKQALTAQEQQAFAQQVAARSLAGAEAERLFSQQIAAQGMAGTEAERLFAQQLAARQLGGTEAERAFAQQVQARQIAGAEGGQAFQQALALRELAGSEAARQFGQQLAARQQLMGEGGQVFGETVTARQLGSAEAQQAFAQQMALRQLAGAEFGDVFGRSLAARQQAEAEAGSVFGRSLAARQLAGAEAGDIFGRSLAAQQQAAAIQGQTFGQSLAARQALLAQQQQQQATAMALRSQLIGERGQLFGQDLAARQALLGERIAEQERQYEQFFNIAQLGANAATGQASAIQAAASNIGNLMTQQGNAYAAGQIGAQNARAGMTQGLLQAGATLGGAMIIASDRRVKTDIVSIGAMYNGFPLYSFRYKGKPEFHMGVMAQDVEKVKPEAVIEINGIKHVNYGAL